MIERSEDIERPWQQEASIPPRSISWPAAFAFVFGGVPLAVLAVFAVCAYPLVGLPLAVLGVAATCYERRQTRRAALADRAAAQYARNAAVVAAPLPIAYVGGTPSAYRAAPTRRRPIEPAAQRFSEAATMPLSEIATQRRRREIARAVC